MHEGTAVAGRYRLLERVGAGGMGEVWRATDELLGRTVAVKVVLPALHADPDFVRRFLAEARAMASVHHPGVVAIHDFGEAHGVAYIVMEYVAGEPLSHMLGRVGRLTPASTMDLVSQTAQALQAVHNRGVVHRDIKPSNLMIRPEGTVALADFGIAVALDSTALTHGGQLLGTPSYLAPEQVLGQPASALSDVYALGLVAYECLAGRKPFDAEEAIAVALQRVHYAAPQLPPDVPPHMAGVVMRALATEPSRRWPTAAEFALAAEHAVRGPVQSGPPRNLPAQGVPPQGIPALGGPPRGGPAQGLPHQGIPAHGGPAHGGPAHGGPAWSGAGPGRRVRRWPLAVAAAVVAVLVGAGVTLWATGALKPSASANSPTATLPSLSSGTPAATTPAPAGPPVPTGFVACGAMLCPVGPMCWRGLVQQGDRPFPPGKEDCTAPHYWETFAAMYVPDEVTTDRQLSNLMQRQDVAAACSTKTMADRSRNPALTRGWRREAWPIPADAYTLLVHCLAGSPDGERPGAAFRSGS